MILGYEVFGDNLESYSVNVRTGTTINSGKIVPAYTAQQIELAVYPFDMTALNYLPEGFYTLQDVKAYQIGPAAITPFSQFVYDGNTYEVQAVMDRSDDPEVYFTEYLCKRLTV